jgi:methionyl-tRNA synthetase
MDWGVPVPLPEAAGKVLYVWFDAPIGYISATKHWAAERAAAHPDRFSPDDWKPWWQASDTRLVHFIGKDNIVFHCIIFPIILMGHGEYIWADQVPANEFLNLEGEKISTSRNWAVWAHEFLAQYPDQVDVLRYVLASLMPETKDNDFTWADYQARNNNELVATLGNFVHRVLTLIHKYYGGTVPAPVNPTERERDLLAHIPRTAAEVGQALERFRFREALAAAMELARAGNKYLADTEPWKLHKTDPEATQTVLYTALQVVAALGIVFEPFMPDAAAQIRRMVRRPEPAWAQLDAAELVAAGTEIDEAQMLFRKLDDEFVAQQLAKLHASRPVPESAAPEAPADAPTWPPAPKPEITYEQFAPLDLRVATVTAAERVPKADKLLKLTLDAGTDVRTVVSGIAEHFAPEEVVGRQVVLLANLAPRKLRGIESQGMILMAEDAEGRLHFVRPEGLVAPGSEVR